MGARRKLLGGATALAAAGMPFLVGQRVAGAENPTQDSHTQTFTFSFEGVSRSCTISGSSSLFKPASGSDPGLRGSVVTEVDDSEADPYCRAPNTTLYATATYVDSDGTRQAGSAQTIDGNWIQYFTNDVASEFAAGHMVIFKPEVCSTAEGTCSFFFETAPAQPK